MWLVELSLVAVIVTAIWYIKEDSDSYNLGFLTLILWGTTIMVFVDHVMGYIMEGGEFIEMTKNATVLGIVLTIVALGIWELSLILKDPKERLKKFSSS